MTRMTSIERIAAIKRVWEPGDTAKTLAVKLRWPVGTVLHNFYHHREALHPCELQGDRVGKKKVATTASPCIRDLFDMIDASGMTYDQVSKRAGMSRPTLTRWKHGNYSPSLISVENVAQAIGLNLRFSVDND